MEGDEVVVIDTHHERDLLGELASNETSLFGLVRTLLSPKTLPHLALITALSTLLYFIANSNEGGDIAALGFISLSCGYAITALFSNNQRVRSWISLSDQSETEEKVNLISRFFTSFKICIFPLAVSGILGLLIMMLFAQDSASDLPAAFPISLGSLFILWAVAQGRSFGSWASSLAAKKLPPRESSSGNIKAMTALQLCAILVLSGLGVVGFQFLYEKEYDVADALVSNIIFFVLAVAVYGLTVAWTWKQRQMSLRDKALKRFASRWTFFAHVFATWHLLTVWRQLVMSPGTIEVFIEEILLMMFTVFMAIWSITSKSVGSKFKFLSTENALPWGLSFGYAYAGSVAMLATAFNDITYVMVSGHIIALLTITWLQRSVLENILEQHDLSVSAARKSKQSSLPTEEETSEPEQSQSEEASEQESQPEENIQVEWTGDVGPSMSDEVEWDDVIELND